MAGAPWQVDVDVVVVVNMFLIVVVFVAVDVAEVIVDAIVRCSME